MMAVAYGAMSFAEKLDREIDRRGTNQSELSRKTGLSQSAISEMTKGKRRPFMDQSLLLARALGVSLDYLADDTVEEEPAPGLSGSVLSLEEQMILKAVRAFGFEESWRRLHPALPEGFVPNKQQSDDIL